MIKYGIWSPPEGWVAGDLAVDELKIKSCNGGGTRTFIVKNINDAFRYQEFLYKFYEEEYEFEVREKKKK